MKCFYKKVLDIIVRTFLFISFSEEYFVPEKYSNFKEDACLEYISAFYL